MTKQDLRRAVISRFLLVSIGFSFLCLCGAYAAMLQMQHVRPVSSVRAQTLPTIVIDAGHGGMDGGAVGVNRELEKDINLEIANTLNELLQAGGYRTVMVRTKDVSIHDPQFTSVRSQKTSDIKNRLKLAEGTSNSVYVSIHLNHFEQISCHGSQIFYSKNHPESVVLATLLREQFRTLLQPENEREIKPANKNLYILTHTNRPAVLVECGFLSNPTECEKLTKESYQQQVAFTIYTALLKYNQDE